MSELCSELELSSMAVRRQLSSLEGEDLVSFSWHKKKMGRPARRYYLTEKGHETFERDYANLAIDLLVSIRTLEGTSKVHEVFEQRRNEHLRKYRERISGKTLETRVHQISQVLTDDGYMAAWEKVGPNQYMIRLMNCAVGRWLESFRTFVFTRRSSFLSSFKRRLLENIIFFRKTISARTI